MASLCWPSMLNNKIVLLHHSSNILEYSAMPSRKTVRRKTITSWNDPLHYLLYSLENTLCNKIVLLQSSEYTYLQSISSALNPHRCETTPCSSGTNTEVWSVMEMHWRYQQRIAIERFYYALILTNNLFPVTQLTQCFCTVICYLVTRSLLVHQAEILLRWWDSTLLHCDCGCYLLYTVLQSRVHRVSDLGYTLVNNKV